MYRALMTSLAVLAGIAVAGPGVTAPPAKDPPKKESPIVGEWRLLSFNGHESFPFVYNFGADGKLVGSGWIGTEFSFEAQYETNEKTDPFQVDLTHRGEREEGLYKIEGDRLTRCYRIGRGQRPKKFGEKGATEEVFERVKKKKD
jgi:uncharacterized protein (TIGR03067 family)